MKIERHGIKNIYGTNYIVLYETEYAEWWFLPILGPPQASSTGPGIGPIFATSKNKAIEALKEQLI